MKTYKSESGKIFRSVIKFGKLIFPCHILENFIFDRLSYDAIIFHAKAKNKNKGSRHPSLLVKNLSIDI